MAGEFERLLDEAVQAVNQASPGHIIDDSGGAWRDAGRRVPAKAVREGLELRSQRELFPLRPTQTARSWREDTRHTGDSCPPPLTG